MEFFEKDLEEIIFTADKEELLERGLDLTGGKLFRQFKIGNYGIADLVYCTFQHDNPYRGYLNIQIIELKKGKIGISAFLQAVGYAKGIQRWFSINKPNIDYKISICLIGENVDLSGNFCYLPDLFDNEHGGFCSVIFKEYEYSLNGLTFIDMYGHKLTNECFKKQ